MPRPARSTTAKRTATRPTQPARTSTPTSAEAPPFPARLKKAAAALAKAAPQAGALLVTSPIDVRYLTGFAGGDSYLLLPSPQRAESRPVIISDFRFQEELEHVKPFCDVVIRTGPLLPATVHACRERLPASAPLAVQAEHLTIHQYAALAFALTASAAKARRAADPLVNTTGLIAGLRAIKDAGEVALIRKAVAIQEAALTQTLAVIQAQLDRAGFMIESDAAAELEYRMRLGGSPATGFGTIIASGPNGSLPHYRAGPAKILPRVPLLIDWGATYQGYHGDMTRVVCFGPWPEPMRTIYQIVLEAQQAAAAALKPGVRARAVDAIARNIITKAGFGEKFGHGLGHGLGLNGHEDPRLSHMADDEKLRPGHVVTVEPGIYLPGLGGVRIEDDYLITATGAENLCSLPKSLRWATR